VLSHLAYLRWVSELSVAMGEVALISHNAVTIVVEMPTPLSFKFVVQLLHLLVLLRILEMGHHHHVLVYHGLLVLNLLILLADRPSATIAGLVSSANLLACDSWNVRIVVCRII